MKMPACFKGLLKKAHLLIGLTLLCVVGNFTHADAAKPRILIVTAGKQAETYDVSGGGLFGLWQIPGIALGNLGFTITGYNSGNSTKDIEVLAGGIPTDLTVFK